VSTHTATTHTPTTPEPEHYDWTLPLGDITVTINEDVLYRIVYRGACSDAQQYLDDWWSTLRSPRAVLLYQSAIDFCGGDEGAARAHFTAAATYGWEGVASPYLDCNVYKAASSVVQQQPVASFTCPTGPGPTWPDGVDPAARDDPRTAEDESLAATTTIPGA
jgi:hypothetical protein